MAAKQSKGDAAVALLKTFLESSSLIKPKDERDARQAFGIVITSELVYAICEEFGWDPGIVSKNQYLTGVATDGAKPPEKTEEELILIP